MKDSVNMVVDKGNCRGIPESKRAEKLEDSQEFNSVILENLANPILTANPDSSIRYTNPALEKLTGYSSEELAGCKFPYPWWPKDKVEQYTIDFTQVIRKGANKMEKLFQKKTGEPFWVEINVSLILDQGRQLKYNLASWADITQRKKVEEALKELEAKYRNVVELAEDGICIIQNMVVKYCNPQLAKMWGGTADEVTGAPFSNYLHPDAISLVVDRYNRRNAGEQVPSRYETALRDKDGRKLNVELHIGILDYLGKEAEIVIVHDITEGKKAEEALFESQEFRSSILENAPNPIMFINPDTSLRYVNPALEKLTGFSSAELIGSKFPRPWWPKDKMKLYTAVLGQDLNQRRYKQERLYQKKDGELFWAAMNGTPIIDQEGNLKYHVSNWVDITDRKKAEKALIESQEFSSSLLENSPNAVVVINPDTSIKYINPEFEKINGWTLDEVAGIKTPYPWWPEELKEASMSGFKTAMEQGSGRGEVIAQKKNGERYWIDIKWSSVKRNAESWYLVINSMDITERRKMEEALKESEARYRNVVENSNDGIVIIQDNRVKFCNSYLEKVTGFSLEECLDKPFIDFVSPQYRKPVIESYEQRMAGQIVPNRYEIDLLTKDNKPLSVEINTSTMEYENKPANMAIIRDVTERKEAEKSLRDSEEHFRLLTKMSPLPMVVIDEHEEIQYLNDRCISTFGYTLEDTPNMESWFRLAYPDEEYRRQEWSDWRKASKESTHAETRIEPHETKVRCKDGTFRILEAYGTHIGNTSLMALKDITESKKAEEGLRHAAEEWRTTFDSITDSISIIGRDFKIIRVNKAFSNGLGKRPEELVDKVCYKAMLGRNEPCPDCYLEELQWTKRAVMREISLADSNIHVEVTASPIFDGKGEVVVCVRVARDVTEREKMQEQLMLADRLASVGELASGIAHELNNPLTSVIGFTQLLLERDIPNDLKEDLGLVNSEAQRCASIVQNLLTFARKHAPVKQLGQVNDIIEDVLRLRAYERKVSNIEVERRFAPDLPQIMVDYFQMQQVFLNLIINAEYFMIQAHSRGRLTIVTERLKSTVRISITDDGPGIPKENMSHLFNPFFTTKEVGKGTGLGLSICHGIVAELGGKISATSQSGKGATFVVELPVNSD